METVQVDISLAASEMDCKRDRLRHTVAAANVAVLKLFNANIPATFDYCFILIVSRVVLFFRDSGCKLQCPPHYQ